MIIKNIKKVDIPHIFILNFLSILIFVSVISPNLYSQSKIIVNGKQAEGQFVDGPGNLVPLNGMCIHDIRWPAACIYYGAMNAPVHYNMNHMLRLELFVQGYGYVTDLSYYKSFINDLIDCTEEGPGTYCSILDRYVYAPGGYTNIDKTWDYGAYSEQTLIQ